MPLGSRGAERDGAQVPPSVPDGPMPRSSLRRRVIEKTNRFVALARAVADVDPSLIESTAVDLGRSRRYLAPVAWAAGTLVLVLGGVKLLLLNWRLSLIELVPAAWVWLAMWDIRRHGLRAEPFRDVTVGGVVLALLLMISVSIAAFWCNTVFGFAITHRQPRVGSAVREARPFLGRIAVMGSCCGVVVTAAVFLIPRISSSWVYVGALYGFYSLMLTVLVIVPARILGVRKERRTPTETVGYWAAGGALSAVAMTPGFVLDRIGLVMIGLPHLHVVGFIVLSVGAALYAAGMSSVRAIKLSMKLESPQGPASVNHREADGPTASAT
jgi:hypothetical protein